jgi:hypothetical protein
MRKNKEIERRTDSRRRSVALDTLRGIEFAIHGIETNCGFHALGMERGRMTMSCNIREPYVLQAMGKACSQIATSKGYLAKADRDHIADQIVIGASAGVTNVNRLVALAIGDQGSNYVSLRPPVRRRACTVARK